MYFSCRRTCVRCPSIDRNIIILFNIHRFCRRLSRNQKHRMWRRTRPVRNDFGEHIVHRFRIQTSRHQSSGGKRWLCRSALRARTNEANSDNGLGNDVPLNIRRSRALQPFRTARKWLGRLLLLVSIRMMNNIVYETRAYALQLSCEIDRFGRNGNSFLAALETLHKMVTPISYRVIFPQRDIIHSVYYARCTHFTQSLYRLLLAAVKNCHRLTNNYIVMLYIAKSEFHRKANRYYFDEFGKKPYTSEIIKPIIMIIMLSGILTLNYISDHV